MRCTRLLFDLLCRVEAFNMTKRIVSGIFILAALGALGVILAGALTSGEQLIVRFLTAVIVAALGLYVISDLRLQTEESEEPTETHAPSVTTLSAPPNSTAAYMATVTNGYGTDKSGAVRRDNWLEEPKPPRHRPARQPAPPVAVGSADPGRTLSAPSTSLDSRTDSPARVVQTGPPPMPPAGPAPMEPVTSAPTAKARPRSLDDIDATATAPIPITRWTAGIDHEDGGEPTDLIETTLADQGDRDGIGDDKASGGSSSAGSAPAVPWPAPEASTSDGADNASSLDDSPADGPTYSHLDSSTYSGRLEAARSQWPAPEVEDGSATPGSDDTGQSADATQSDDENTTVTETSTRDSEDPAPTAVTNKVIDIGPRLTVVPDHEPDEGGPDTEHHPTAADDGTAISLDLDAAETDDGVLVMNEGGDDTVNEAASPVDRDDAEKTSERKPLNLDVAGNAVVAASYADTPRPPMLDLRDGSAIEPEGVTKAIEAGEYQVIETLIRQGMLSTVGPITDRDVRTMVYVAFTSNELRKLILAGGRPETERTDLDLGPVELFDERRFAPTPRTIYTLPETAPTASSPAVTENGDASYSTPEPSTSDELTPTTMPAPRHLYRLDTDNSPETVA